MEQLLTGNQAVALGALRAGVKVVTGYPGTPSTGCLTHLLTLDLPERHIEWSTNEKVAFEIAAGAAWAGQRAMCTMKMTGVNVAYDALISIAYSGTNGGLVIYVADDPGVSAGMAEQDSRGFALMSDLPMIEPTSPAEAYELTQAAFELSEKTGAPVFLRLTTAAALSRSVVECGGLHELAAPPPVRQVVLERDIARYTKAGSKICLDQHRAMIERLERAGELIHEMGLNRLDLSEESGGLGIIASGAVNAYLDEACKLAASASPDPGFASMLDGVSILHASATTPFPWEETKALLEHCGQVLVLEELEPHMERSVVVVARQLGFVGPIIGKIDGTLPRIGEYGVTEILRGLAAAGSGRAAPRERSSTVLARTDGDEHGRGAGILPATSPNGEPPGTVLSSATQPAPRPITVCAGCPHRGTYLGIEAAIKAAGLSNDEVMVTGDIGCTILGMNPPFDLLWTEVSMGSSVSLAQGYVHAGVRTPVIATIGDSTFFHGGISGLVNAIQHQTPLTLVIMDNGWTSMTGMQVNAGTDNAFQPAGGRRLDLVRVVEGLGPDSMAVVDPYDVEAVAEAVGFSLAGSGVHVVIARRECAIQARRRGVIAEVTTVDPEKCILCKRCLRVTGCPALSLPKAEKEPARKPPDDDFPRLGGSAAEAEEQLGESAPAAGPPTSASIQIDAETCNGCGICAAVCPTGALGNSRDASHEALGEGAVSAPSPRPKEAQS